MKGYEFNYQVRRTGVLPWGLLADIFAEAAAHLEGSPQYDCEWAIAKATDRMPERTALIARFAFRDNFGVWNGDDESVMMLCFAACAARCGEMS